MSTSASRSPLSVPVFQILLSCSDSVLHGYAIIQDVRERTGGRVHLTASTLYGALKRLLADGLVEEQAAHPGPRTTIPGAGTTARRTRAGRCWPRKPHA